MSRQCELRRHKELHTTAWTGHCDWSGVDNIMCGVGTWLAASPGTYMWRNMLIWKWNGNHRTKDFMPSVQDVWKYSVVELSRVLYTSTRDQELGPCKFQLCLYSSCASWRWLFVCV